MKLPVPFTALAAFLAVTGCAQLDVAPESSQDRVLTGTINVRATVPAGAQILIRVIDVSNREVGSLADNNLPLANRPRPVPVERVLGAQTLTLPAATNEPVPFRVEYRADDALLRHGLNIDVRISVDGKLRHRSVNAHVLTQASSPFPHEVVVDPVQ